MKGPRDIIWYNNGSKKKVGRKNKEVKVFSISHIFLYFSYVFQPIPMGYHFKILSLFLFLAAILQQQNKENLIKNFVRTQISVYGNFIF